MQESIYFNILAHMGIIIILTLLSEYLQLGISNELKTLRTRTERENETISGSTHISYRFYSYSHFLWICLYLLLWVIISYLVSQIMMTIIGNNPSIGLALVLFIIGAYRGLKAISDLNEYKRRMYWKKMSVS